MIIKIRELCWVDCINESNENEGENLKAERIVIYETNKNNLKEAFKDYEENFDCDNILECEDMFDGGCLDIIKTISVEDVSEEY